MIDIRCFALLLMSIFLARESPAVPYKSILWSTQGPPSLEQAQYHPPWAHTELVLSDQHGTEIDRDVFAAWDDETDRLYFYIVVSDYVHYLGPDHADGDGVCGGYDRIWLELDVGGRGVQKSEFFWPPLEKNEDDPWYDRKWHKVEGLPDFGWYEIEPYSGYPWSYWEEYHGEWRILSAEGFVTYFKHLDADSAEPSKVAPMEDNDIIRFGVSICDANPGTEDTLWRTKHPDGRSGHGTELPEWCLAVDDHFSCGLGTAVSPNTEWGRIKFISSEGD